MIRLTTLALQDRHASDSLTMWIHGTLNKFVQLVDEGKVSYTEDGFTSRDKVYITYEVLSNESRENKVVEKTSTP